jgi:hypothetical protein
VLDFRVFVDGDIGEAYFMGGRVVRGRGLLLMSAVLFAREVWLD